MSRNNGTTREIWLRMLRERRRYQASEISEILSISTMEAAQALYRMDSNGSALRHQLEGRNVAYSVTPDCTVPRGVTLADLVEVGIAKETA